MFPTANPSIGGFDVRCLMFDVKSLGDASQASEIMTSVAVHIRHAGRSRTNTAHFVRASEGNIYPKSLSNSLCVPIHAHSIVSPVRLPTARMSRLTLTDQ